MGFVKLDDQLGDSSLMACPSDTFKVFVYILSRCGPDGISRTSPTGISAHCFLSLDVVRRAIETLESPDPDSRSKVDEGRRIKDVDGGFLVVNYLKYRERGYSMKDSARRMREKRDRDRKREKAEEKRTKAEEKKAKAEENTFPSKREAEATCAHNVTDPPVNGVYFDGDEWRGLTPDFIESLREKFPISNVMGELEKMAAWIKKDPSRHNLEDRAEFIDRWIKRPWSTNGKGGSR